MNIKDEADRLERVLESRIKAWQAELDVIEKEIKQWDEILADKESKTDRSENATFQLAKDSRDIKMTAYNTVYKKIQTYMDYKNTYQPTGVITIGSTVEVRPTSINGSTDFKDKESSIIKLVVPGLSDASSNLIGTNSAIGGALIDHQVGDTITVRTRVGTVSYVIERMY